MILYFYNFYFNILTGEYCLTVDLGCLLLQKRKRQLDQVAKIEEVDSIMDIKIDKKSIKDKLYGGKINKKGLNKFDNEHEIEKPNFVDSLEIKDMNASQEISLTSLKSQENLLLMQNKKKKMKRELKIHAQICKILSNIIYMILKEYQTDELNFIISPINIIYMYLSSCISSQIRRKEMIKVINIYLFLNSIYKTIMIRWLFPKMVGQHLMR